jgi:hypothetical protein
MKFGCTLNTTGMLDRRCLASLKRFKRLGKEEYCRLLKKELSYLSMHPIDDSDSEGSSNGKSDSNTDSDFKCPQRKTTFKSLVDHAPDWRFLETDSLMI